MEQIAPPQAPAIEKDVLSVLINRPELIYQVDDLIDENCFYDDDFRIIYAAVIEIHQSGLVVTQSAILHRIVPAGLLPTYQDVKKFFTSERSLIGNAEILAEYSTKRALLTKSLQLLQMIQRNESIDDIEAEVTEATSIVISRNKSTEAVSMGEAFDGMIDLMNREKKNGITGIPTGLPSLDRITGGWEFDEMALIAARPGMGKTIVATFHSFAAAYLGYPAAFISLEVQPNKLAARMASNLSSVPSSDITKGRLADNQKQIVIEKSNDHRSVPIYFYDNTKSCDINDISRTIRVWHRKYGIKIVFLDYIGLCSDRTIKNSSDQTAITSSVQKKLTELKNQLGIPFVVFSQLNRSNESRGDKRPQLSDLKHTGKLEEDATKVIFLYRQDYYDANEAESRGETFTPTNDMEYIFAKNREGMLGPVLLKCDVALNRMYELPKVGSVESTNQPFLRNQAMDGIKPSF
jgi:replicative DNA helicase